MVGGRNTPGLAAGAAWSGASVFVADYSAGLQVIPIPCDPASVTPPGDWARPGLHIDVFPNPGSEHACFRLELPTGASIGLGIVDPSGRVVRRLVERPLPAGVHRLYWDGRDDAGREVPAGLYLLHVSGVRATGLGRVVIAR
jgi:hypothetical protein